MGSGKAAILAAITLDAKHLAIYKRNLLDKHKKPFIIKMLMFMARHAGNMI
jgi:hypothetical protein